MKLNRTLALDDPLSHRSRGGEGGENLIELLRDLYSGKGAIEELKNVRLNPSYEENYVFRWDLEFYIPQLCNFMLFHEGMLNSAINELILQACATDIYFAHLTYWYLFSLSKDEEFTRESRPVSYTHLTLPTIYSV
eukprot:TRINITY_DN10892_c0_g1_i2.p1 TRINITY_DN10892_c0_g1~~TRINITY_DN10892_c0_g1_i2.p1  ORF type:complete len:136 (-),score=20.16 TRINITY_DN10892_c0_g1_i2:32-439(-)